MKCQSLLFEKSKKNIINLSPAEFVQRMVKVKYLVVILGVKCFGKIRRWAHAGLYVEYCLTKNKKTKQKKTNTYFSSPQKQRF